MHASQPASIIRKFAAGAFLAASVFASAGAAHAVTPEEKVTLRFEYDRAAPAKSTYWRLQRAAIRACDVTGSTIVQRSMNPCVTELVEAAVARMGLPAIAELHDQRTGERPTQVASR